MLEASQPLPRALQNRRGAMNLSWRKTRRGSRIAPLTLCLCFGFSYQALNAQTVKVHVSSKSGDRIAAKADMQFADSKPAGGATFQIATERPLLVPLLDVCKHQCQQADQPPRRIIRGCRVKVIKSATDSINELAKRNRSTAETMEIAQYVLKRHMLLEPLSQLHSESEPP